MGLAVTGAAAYLEPPLADKKNSTPASDKPQGLFGGIKSAFSKIRSQFANDERLRNLASAHDHQTREKKTGLAGFGQKTLDFCHNHAYKLYIGGGTVTLASLCTGFLPALPLGLVALTMSGLGCYKILSNEHKLAESLLELPREKHNILLQKVISGSDAEKTAANSLFARIENFADIKDSRFVSLKVRAIFGDISADELDMIQEVLEINKKSATKAPEVETTAGAATTEPIGFQR